jgi:alkanesulfonate monooxygenase SsuD/methylene tetrahydromethanopterin reductase-like flavin-dependent oxidoreductase (luciferase family)
MRVGLHALGIGPGARPEVIRAVAVAAEVTGFATLWSGEHVVLVDQPRSRYPYSADGRPSGGWAPRCAATGVGSLSSWLCLRPAPASRPGCELASLA